ncbi:hypothetical protein HYDPIDRAFT_174589 [Hydnomerulius pinastri MD-312]|nr:hypothetical protein HYDPIDRAFT_174589 [Hydnomerulius pinastri MD-312]
MSGSVRRGWYPALTTALARLSDEKGRTAIFQMATLEAPTYTPRVRSLVHREFLTASTLPDLPLILGTTDIRTPKVGQINADQRVEAVYWIESTQEQFRITGRAWLVPSPDYHASYPLGAGRVFDALKEQGFDWEKKRREMFDLMTGHMKASWCRPVPGSPLEGGNEEAEKWPKTLPKLDEPKSDEDEKNLQFALKNFALLLIEPYEVDFVELKVQPNQRTNFKRDPDSDSAVFEETIVVP